MDAKTEAQHRREIADALDQVAEKYKPLSADTAEFHRGNAEANRRRADELDPPQPEWQDGDLVRDRNGNLWEYDGYSNMWGAFGVSGCRSTATLDEVRGPLTRVLTYDPATQRVADPAKQEVVVSLDGINRSMIVPWEQWAGCDLVEAVGRIVAEAAREQLGEVQ